jgi:hypothetical protein
MKIMKTVVEFQGGASLFQLNRIAHIDAEKTANELLMEAEFQRQVPVQSAPFATILRSTGASQFRDSAAGVCGGMGILPMLAAPERRPQAGRPCHVARCPEIEIRPRSPQRTVFNRSRSSFSFSFSRSGENENDYENENENENEPDLDSLGGGCRGGKFPGWHQPPE